VLCARPSSIEPIMASMRLSWLSPGLRALPSSIFSCRDHLSRPPKGAHRLIIRAICGTKSEKSKVGFPCSFCCIFSQSPVPPPCCFSTR